MRKSIAALMFTLVGSGLLAQPAPAQQPASGSQTRSLDVYADMHRAAREKEQIWQAANGDLLSTAAFKDPCSDEATAPIRTAKDLAAQTFAARKEYYQRWQQLARQDAGRFARVMSDRATMRAELDNRLSMARQEIEDLRTRRNQLAKDNGETTNGVAKAITTMDSLLANAERRVQNTQDSLTKWEEAQQYSREAKDSSEDLFRAVQGIGALVESEELLWQSYYDAVESRIGLRCALQRPKGVQEFQSYRPPMQ